MPTNVNAVKLSNRIEQIKGEFRARMDRATPEGETQPDAKMFKAMNPDIKVSMGQYAKERSEELAAAQAEMNDYLLADESMKSFEQVAKDGEQPVLRAPQPSQRGPTLAEAIMGEDGYKSIARGETKGVAFDVDVRLKSLFEDTAAVPTGDNVSVESIRTGELEMMPRTRVTLLDIIPQEPTTDPSVKYDREVKNKSAAAPIAQGAVYKEAAFRIVEATTPVVKVGEYVEVSEELLSDRAEMRARIDGSLRDQMMRRVQSDVVGGAPIPAAEYVSAPADSASMVGFLDLPVTGGTFGDIDHINTIDGNAGQNTGNFINPFTLIEQAQELIYRHGLADADAIVMNSQDWLQVSTLQATTGQFIIQGALAPLAAPVQMRLNGLPVVRCNALPNNTVLVGAFGMHSMIRDRQSVQVRIQEAQTYDPTGSGAARTKPSGTYNIYTDCRFAFYARRPQAFCKITDFGVAAS